MRDRINEIYVKSMLEECCIHEDKSRLVTLKSKGKAIDISLVIKSLRNDQVILIQNVEPDEADSIMLSIAEKFELSESLEVQSGFVSNLEHRNNVGRYFMSVNKRKDYQFISSHSEGDSFIKIQLASFYCFENSTDGGASILMNVNQQSDVWAGLREKVRRGKSNRTLTPSEISQIKIMVQLNMPEDTLKESDEILSQNTVVPGFTVFEVLTSLRKTHCKVLDKKLYVYWDSISSIDHDSALEYYDFLKKCKLLKLNPNNLDIRTLDNASARRLGNFGSKYDQLFKCKITHKMQPGDFIIQNNLSWTHSASNWTPGSGTRNIVGSFA